MPSTCSAAGLDSPPLTPESVDVAIISWLGKCVVIAVFQKSRRVEFLENSGKMLSQCHKLDHNVNDFFLLSRYFSRHA